MIDEQAEIRRLRQENTALKRDLEVAKGAFEDIRKQRDDSERQRDDLADAINALYEQTQQDAQYQTALDQRLVSEINSHLATFQETYTVTALIDLRNRLEARAVQVFNQWARNKDELSTRDKLEVFPFLAGIAIQRHITREILIEAYAHAGNSGAICETIIRSLRTTGQVDIKWLQLLTKWLNQHQCKKPETAKQWLELAEQHRKSGEKKQSYTYSTSIDRTALDRAKRLYKAIKDEASTLAPEIKALITAPA